MSSIDLATTTSGDIYFESASHNNTLNIAFNLVYKDYDCLQISFNHIKRGIPEITPYSCSISLEYDDKNVDSFKVACVKDTNVLANKVKYAIKTTLTDLSYNTDFGSNLELYMHKNLRDSNLVATIESVVSKAITGLINAPTVKATPKVKLMNNYDITYYYQGIDIDIYSYDDLILSYTV